MNKEKLTKKFGEEEQEKSLHVDDFVSYGTMREVKNEDYARFVLLHFRLPAMMKFAFEKFTHENKLFCKYDGKEWRVIGASRLGDIWLTADFSKRNGYDLRVMADKCSDWSDKQGVMK